MKKGKGPVSITRRIFINSAPFLLVALFLLCVAGCSAESRARRALNRIVYKEINQFNKFHLRKVRPNAYIHGRRFYRVYKERIDHEADMRSTKAPNTPFVATLGFTENTYLTTPRDSRQECMEDSHFVLSESKEREIVYTYVGGLWRRKEIY